MIDLLVAKSATMRGVFTAINRVTGSPGGHTYKAFENASLADAWLADDLGERFAVATRREGEARARRYRAAQG